MSEEDKARLARDHKLLDRRLPDNIQQEIKCTLCGKTKHFLKLNDRVGFYVHRGDELKTCRAIGLKTSFAIDLGKQMYERYQKNVREAEAKRPR